MSAYDLIPLDVAQTLADVFAGKPLNGQVPTQARPPWRSFIHDLQGVSGELAQARVLLDALFTREQFNEDEIAAVQAAILALKPGEHATASAPIRVFRGRELFTTDKQRYLLKDLMPESSFVVLVGEDGKGKTFTALDMACRLAQSGREVVYVAAEGQYGLKKRLAAWLKYYNDDEDLPTLAMITIPVYPQDPTFMNDVYTSLEAAGITKPVLTIFDTLSMCYIGSEDDSEAMKGYVDGLVRYRIRYGCAVMSLHHTGWNIDRMGGNRKLQNAADVMMRIQQDETGTITLSCTKMRDGEKFRERYFSLQVIELGAEKEDWSCVLIPASAESRPRVALPEKHKTVLDVIRLAGDQGLRFSEIGRTSGVTRNATLVTILEQLMRGGLLDRAGKEGAQETRYFHTGKEY